MNLADSLPIRCLLTALREVLFLDNALHAENVKMSGFDDRDTMDA